MDRSGYFRRVWIILGAFVVAGVFLFTTASEFTSRTAFCNNCHEMETATVSWQSSSHGSNAAGIEAGCADCHISPGISGHVTAKINALGELYVHVVESPQGYWWIKEKAERQWQARKDIKDGACLTCHEPAKMDLDDETAHKTAIGKTRCVNCHSDVGHNAKKGSDVGEI